MALPVDMRRVCPAVMVHGAEGLFTRIAWVTRDDLWC
jgi:hypothetical protein